MNFSELDLRPELQEALKNIGFSTATPIQEAVIPHVLKGKDISGLAQTGTGKTGAFLIPLIDRILRKKAGEEGERVPAQWNKNSYALILVPTRELASQVEETLSKLTQNTGLRSVVVAGGTSYDPQKKALKEGVDFVVGTPGRILDLFKSHDLDLNGVGAIVFDEADRMFDMGFKDDMKFILRRVPRHRHFLLFSATLNFDVVNTAYQFGAEPMEINLSRDQITADGIDHEIVHIAQEEKPMYLISTLKKYAPQQCIVFSNFKHNVGRVARFLKANGYEATDISSLLSQHQRNKVIESFKTGKKQILVATDVAARGLDIKGIDLVINYELPDDPEGYVHRIGRTGRAGTSGKAIGLVSDRDVDALQRIEEYLKEKVKIGWFDDTDLVKEFNTPPAEEERPRPKPHGGPGGGPRSHGHGRRGPGGPPRHDRERHGERGPRHGSRPGPSAQEPKRDTGHGQTAGQRQPHNTVAGQEHRDRRLGRHRGVALDSKTAPSQQGNGKPRHGHGHKHHGQRHENSNYKRRQLGKRHERPQEKKQQSIGQKIKKFFSRLFS